MTIVHQQTTDLMSDADAAASANNAATDDTPALLHVAYERMKPRWEKCRDVFMGTEAIRAGGIKYLPMFQGEDEDRYEVRKNLAAFQNAFARTVLASVGMLHDEPIELSDDNDQQLKDMAENVDRQGNSVTVFSSKLTTSAMIDSNSGILTDMPKRADAIKRKRGQVSLSAQSTGVLDASEEKKIGMRPFFVMVKADNVFKPIYLEVDGVKTLVLQTFREFITERVGTFSTRTITQYRVYTNTNGKIECQLWREPVGGGTPTIFVKPWLIENQTEIPWSPLVAGEIVVDGEYQPPLIHLADMNIEHHNTRTNMLSLQSLAMVPTPVRIGATPVDGVYPPFILGPANTIEIPMMENMPPTPVYWLSPDVAVLGPAERTRLAEEAAMASMGAAFLSSETRAAETAEGKRIDSAAQRATLGTVRTALQDCLERAFGFAGKFLNVKSGSVTVNDDFMGEGIDTAFLQVCVLAYQQNVLQLEELRYVFQTGQLPEEFDAKDTLKLIAKQLSQMDAKREANRLAAQNAGNTGTTQPNLDPQKALAA